MTFPRSTRRPAFHYAWVVVAVTFLVLLVCRRRPGGAGRS